MKSLKITFAVVSILVLTVSGTSLESVEKNDSDSNSNKQYELVAHKRGLRPVAKQG